MKELNDIILSYDKAVLQKKQTALATVVKVEGSSYRRPGARMLVTEEGETTGAISGGCLESDALREAESFYADAYWQSVIDESRNVLHRKISIVQNHANGSILYQFIPPSIQLIIVGAGNDAQPLADMASLLGWNIVVVDGRPAYAAP